jgi:hypothetical protein
MRRYDPDVAPEPAAWLSLDEQIRLDLIRAFHAAQGGFGENVVAHSAFHMVVENQLAMNEPEDTRAALQRLMRDGLSRHDAVHALGYVVVEHIFPILSARGDPSAFDLEAYCAALRALTVASWRAMRG